MKKICYITTVPTTIESFILKTAIYLHENTDWDISIICTDDDAFERSLPEYIHYYPVHMDRGISLAGVKAALQMYKIFSREKYDLIQYSTPNASLYASLAGFVARIPVRLYCQWGMAFVGFEGIKRQVFKIVEKLVCTLSTWIEPDSKSNLIFAHSEGLYPGRKGSVIWNGSACGVDLTKFNIIDKPDYRKLLRQKLCIDKDDFVFGFVGRITRDKGVNELFSAFKTLYNQNQKVHLLMVGRTEIDDSVDHQLYDWIQHNPNVIFVGYTNHVEHYLAAMDCFILPSYREGFGMGVVEAEAMGVPVIVTNIPGPIDAMEKDKTGLVVEKRDVAGLTEAMQKMLWNPEIRNQYGVAALEYAQTNFEQQELFSKILTDRRRLLK